MHDLDLDWRLTNSDSDFDQWRRCAKCLEELVMPKTLHCLHTVCLVCLVAHYEQEYRKFRRQYPNVEMEKYLMPCPFCFFPCHLPRGPNEIVTNKLMLKVAYSQRVVWWREFVTNKDKWITSFELEKIRFCKEMAKQAKKKSSRSKSLKKGAGASDEDQGSNVEVEGASAKVEGASADVQDTTGIRRRKRKSFMFDSHSHVYHWPWEDKLNPEIRRVLRSNLIEHCNSLQQQRIEIVDDDMDIQLPGAGAVRRLLSFELSFGSDPAQCLRACSLDVSSATGNVMVVDNSLGKGVFFRENGTYLGKKYFKHPVVNCTFLPLHKDYPAERFCAIGKKKGDHDTPALLFFGSVNDDPDTFHILQQQVIGDVTGFHCLDGVFYISMGHENRAVWKSGERTLMEISSRGFLHYPTHITSGVENEIIIADTGNHRICVFRHISGTNRHTECHFGSFGHNEGEFFWPLGVAVDKRGRIYVCDSNNYRVQVFNSEYDYECMPIKHTFRISTSVAQDVKPIDCAIDRQQRLLVLFRGKSYCSLQCFAYDHPAWCIYPPEESPKFSLCCDCLCCCSRNSRNRSDYQRI